MEKNKTPITLTRPSRPPPPPSSPPPRERQRENTENGGKKKKNQRKEVRVKPLVIIIVVILLLSFKNLKGNINPNFETCTPPKQENPKSSSSAACVKNFEDVQKKTIPFPSATHHTLFNHTRQNPVEFHKELAKIRNRRRDCKNEIENSNQLQTKTIPQKEKQKQRRRESVKHQHKCEAYQRNTPDNTWKPPRVIIICMLLDVTSGKQAKKVLPDLFKLCPDAKTSLEVTAEDIEDIISTLGLHDERATMIQRFSLEYLWNDWTHKTDLHGVGKYAADAYAIFCTGKWDQVKP
ncbi:hypothetical protein MKW98_025008 [Papaver atlanticum]|uniref:HhH-GPD domain-containing protein n=1 Tax=Papaver atlanticum TaxID=357466 RepID=A0AAD4XNY0_9MAGN|nr:hypothetical protein MKW98_025008 [Papaver atlanticum]